MCIKVYVQMFAVSVLNWKYLNKVSFEDKIPYKIFAVLIYGDSGEIFWNPTKKRTKPVAQDGHSRCRRDSLDRGSQEGALISQRLGY